jgi:hypothetical protein
MNRFKRKISYQEFLDRKSQFNEGNGFDPVFMPDYLFDFQKVLVEWAVRMGRSAIFADCGLGKTPMQLVWSENIVRKTNGKVLILTPLSVSFQTIKEAKKFGVRAVRSMDGKAHKRITITNYEKLHFFNPNDFEGIVCDESSILKNFDGKRKKAITEFMKKKQLDVIDRCIILWSNEGETVFTPFMGVGSEVYGAVANKRKGMGIELKSTYYKQAIKNCKAVFKPKRRGLLD